MWKRVGSCVRKIAQYHNVRELEVAKVVGCLREMQKLESGSEDKSKDRALECEVSEKVLVEARETQVRPWITMLPAVMTVFNCWQFSYSPSCWIIMCVSAFCFGFLIKICFLPSLVIV